MREFPLICIEPVVNISKVCDRDGYSKLLVKRELCPPVFIDKLLSTFVLTKVGVSWNAKFRENLVIVASVIK